MTVFPSDILAISCFNRSSCNQESKPQAVSRPNSLEQLVLKGHVRLRLEADASAEDIGQSRALLGESVDNGSAGRRQRSLEHVAQDAEHTVEVLVLGSGGTIGRGSLPLDARHHLSDRDKVNDQGRSEQRVLTDVEEPAIVSVVDPKGACEPLELTRWSGDRP